MCTSRPDWLTRPWLLGGLILALGGCPRADDDGPAEQPHPPVTSTAGDTALTGPPWFDAIPEVRVANAFEDVAYVALDEESPEYRVSDQVVSLELDPAGSAEAWSALVADLGLTVLRATPGRRVSFVKLPERVTSREQLDAALAALEESPSVRWAWEEPASLPATLPPGVLDLNREIIAPHLAVGVHRLWDLRELTGLLLQNGVMASGPDLHMIDIFGNGAPTSDLFEGVFDPQDFFQTRAGKIVPTHGYQVLSVLAPRYEALPGSPYSPDTELLAGPVTHPHFVSVSDMMIAGTPFAVLNDTLDLPQELGRPVVVQQAHTTYCADIFCFTDLERKAQAFAADLAASGDAHRLLYVVSAGNQRIGQSVASGFDTAPWASIVAQSGVPGSLVVENVLHEEVVPIPEVTQPGDPVFAFCLSSWSYEGGTISAPADPIAVYDSEGTPNPGAFGTSFAAPQVAGAAMVLWQHAPSLSSAEVAERLKVTARPTDRLRLSTSPMCAAAAPAPLLDSHQAVLSADLGVPAAPARRFLLDVDGSGRFDKDDVEAFLDHFADPAVSNQPTFDAYDLNGDGKIGALSKAPYDLDGPFAPAGTALSYAFAHQEMVDEDGTTIQVQYDEKAVSDLDVLCYYAYSPLFHAPDASARNDLLYQDYVARGLSCPRVKPEVSTPPDVCPMSTDFGEWFGVGVHMDPRTAFPVTVEITASGDGAIQTAPPAQAPAVRAQSGVRTNPKTLTGSDPGIVVYGTVSTPGGTMTIDITLSQTDAGGVSRVVATEQVEVGTLSESDCTIPGPAGLPVPRGTGGWRLHASSTGADSYPGASSQGTSTSEAWLSVGAGWSYGTRSFLAGNAWNEVGGQRNTSYSVATGGSHTVYSPASHTKTTTSWSVSDSNGVVYTVGPTTTVVDCEGRPGCGLPPSAPSDDPKCTATRDLVGYDGGSYGWISFVVDGEYTAYTSDALSCTGCQGRSTAGCTCPPGGGVRPQCP